MKLFLSGFFIVGASIALFSTQVLPAIPTGVTTRAVFETSGKNRFNQPIWLGEIPGKPGNFLVAEHHTGNVYTLSPAAQGYAKTFFLKVSVNSSNEQGLLSLAFHPDFIRNHKYYVHYSSPSGARHLAVEEREVSPDLLRDAGKAPRTIIEVPQVEGKLIHNGGNFTFGPDGMAYMSIGDGGESANAQNRSELLGNILRLEIDPADVAAGYKVPKDNPFVAVAGVRPEVWAYGLRNPWRMSWDMEAGDLWIGDVGQSAWEEIDIIRKGENMGWNLMEGTHGNGQGALARPVKDLGRDIANCIVGGVVFRGDKTSAFYGTYLFADHILSNIFGLTQTDRAATDFQQIGKAPAQPMSLSRDLQGNIYLALGNGEIHQLTHTELRPNTSPTRESAPSDSHRKETSLRSLFRRQGGGYVLDPGAKQIDRWEVLTLDGKVAALGSAGAFHSPRILPGLYLVRMVTGSEFLTDLVFLN